MVRADSCQTPRQLFRSRTSATHAIRSVVRAGGTWRIPGRFRQSSNPRIERMGGTRSLTESSGVSASALQGCRVEVFASSHFLLSSVFSPLHALLWHIAGSSLLPISGLAAWMTFFATLAALSAQALLLSTSFTQLVKDRALLAAEMLKEYDQKVGETHCWGRRTKRADNLLPSLACLTAPVCPAESDAQRPRR